MVAANGVRSLRSEVKSGAASLPIASASEPASVPTCGGRPVRPAKRIAAAE
jgi:hypothetical protein